MFKILDGREYFYQWDLDRKLIVEDSSIKQVHFCNRFGNCSLIRATYEVEGVTVVDVPNIILQESFNLYVYGYDINYTKFDMVFDIKPRTKPENYVNTQEEHKLWDELEHKLINLENIVSGEGIAAAVERWLENNPIEAGATAEEAAQIEQNKQDIAQLKEDVKNIDIPEVDLTGYATEKYVDEAIAAIDIPEGGGGGEMPDLSEYATVKYVDTTVGSAVSGLATEAYVDKAANAVKQEIPTILDGYATEQYVDETAQWLVDEKIPDVSGFALTEHEHDVYQTAAEVQALIDASVGQGGGGSVAVDGTTIVQNADGTISTSIGGSKVLVERPAVVYTYKDGTGVSCNSLGRIKIWTTGSNVRNQMQAYKTYYITYKTASMSASTGEIKCTFNKNDSGNYWWDVHDANGIMAQLYADMSNGYLWLVAAHPSTFQNKEYVTYFTIRHDDVYNYETIDARYISVEEGHFITDSGKLASRTPKLIAETTSVYNNYTSNSVDTTKHSIVCLGTANSVASNNQVTLGHSNNAGYYATQYLLGYGNSVDNSTYKTVIGRQNSAKAMGEECIFGGYNTTAGASSTYKTLNNTIIGYNNTISGYVSSNYSMLLGYKNSLRSSAVPTNPVTLNSFFFGQGLSNVTDDSKTQGAYVIDCAVGKYNAVPVLEDVPFVVGMGTADSPSDRKNALSISSTGNLNVNGTVNTQGADYAEYFEWVDGNPEAEDRIGYAVTLEGKKIRIANAEDDVIGFISGTAATVGEDAPWNWHGRDVRDEFGRVQYEEKEFTEEVPEFDEEGNEIGTITISRVKTVAVQNPEWNPEEEYIPRKARAEWDTVGLLGKLYVRDDGSCKVGGYAVVADGGIVTAASGRTNMRVLERTSENIVRVLFK